MIPQGNYGAGTVMIWDKGACMAEDGVPLEKHLVSGKITMVLDGKKLRGGFTLLRTGRRSPVPGEGERWLLIKHRDEHADASWDIERPEFARSVLTGRTLQEIDEGRSGNTSSSRGAIRRAGKKQWTSLRS